MFRSVIVAMVLMSASWTGEVTTGVLGELSSPPNPTGGNGTVTFQHEIQGFHSQLQNLQSKFNLQQQENSQLHTTVSQLLATVSQLQMMITVQQQTGIPPKNTTTSDLDNQSPSLSSLQSSLESLQANYNASVRDLKTSYAHLQDKMDALEDESANLKTTVLHVQEIQHSTVGVQGNVTEFLCEHFTHSNVSVTGNVTAGTAVIRGRDWQYGDQDGHDHLKGVIVDKHAPVGLVFVRWDTGHENIYRVGYEGGYDLYYYYPDVLRKFRHVLCPN